MPTSKSAIQKKFFVLTGIFINLVRLWTYLNNIDLHPMAGYSVINYKGTEIAYIDYRGLKLEQMLQTLDDAVEIAIKRSQEGHPPRPLLTNITGAFAVPEFMEKVKEAGKKTKHLTSKSAIVGITGAKKILLQAYNLFTKLNTKIFDDEELAKEWLIKE